MSLSSVLQTARTGIVAAITSVDAVSHNVANSRTNGYKAIRPVLAEQSPSGDKLQIGSGVRVDGFTTDNTQGAAVATSEGTVELSNTDISNEIVELIMARTQFSANAAVFNTGSQMLDELLSLGRR
ncbi:MAG: flagellar basal body rod C-terminal domain-containing protein [Aeoliella sp.]